MLARLLAIAFTLAPLASALPTSGSTDLRPRIELVVRQNINDQSADALGAVIDITGVALSDIADIGEGLLKRDQARMYLALSLPGLCKSDTCLDDVYTALSGLKSKIDSTITRLSAASSWTRLGISLTFGIDNVGVHGTNAPVTSKQSNEPPNLSRTLCSEHRRTLLTMLNASSRQCRQFLR